MFEVYPKGNGFGWRMIGFCGRTLYDPGEHHPDVGSAGQAAKSWRVSFWAIACQIDHRMGACVW